MLYDIAIRVQRVFLYHPPDEAFLMIFLTSSFIIQASSLIILTQPGSILTKPLLMIQMKLG